MKPVVAKKVKILCKGHFELGAQRGQKESIGSQLRYIKRVSLRTKGTSYQFSKFNPSDQSEDKAEKIVINELEFYFLDSTERAISDTDSQQISNGKFKLVIEQNNDILLFKKTDELRNKTNQLSLTKDDFQTLRQLVQSISSA